MSKWSRITIAPAVMNGQPCIRSMRITVRRVIEALAIYHNWDDLIREYPELDPDDIREALDFAAHNLDHQTMSVDAA